MEGPVKHHLSIVAAIFIATINAGAADRDDAWKKVAEAEKNGLPKTAIEHLEPIIKSAIEEGATAEALKAVLKKIRFEGDVQGQKAEEKIVRLQGAITTTPAVLQPLMEAVLAHWYWQYFQQNRWRFMQRTQTEETPGDDILSWDLTRILAEIDKHFTLALDSRNELRKIAVTDFDEVLQKGSMPESFRPTLYDFIAHEALKFYSAGEQAAAAVQGAFDLNAESPAFDSPETFIAWKIETTDEDSVLVKTLRLYQELMRYHSDSGQTDAFIDANLERLVLANNNAFGESKNDRYKAALKQFTDTYGDHRIAARALYNWASVLQEEGDLVEAHKLATRGANAFPDTPGGNQCHNLIETIEKKSIQVSTERVWNAPWPKIKAWYKNVDKIWFRVVEYDWEQLLLRNEWDPENFRRNQGQELLGRAALKSWSKDLPITTNYHAREEQIDAPQDLAPGFYFLITSHTEDFGANNNSVNYTGFWVSDLAVVTRIRQGTGVIEGFVLDAESGDPLKEATVRIWKRGGRNKRQYQAAGDTATDENGLFSVTSDNTQHVFLAEYNGHKVSTDYYNNRSSEHKPKPDERTVFFTDRSLYRPGQTIHYKALSYRVDTENSDYQTIANRETTIVFADVNNKEITKRTQHTNDYGTFSGSFTAPRDRLMGTMRIRVVNGARGQANINVEEYKRPKFEVTIDAPESAPKLDSDVTVTGHAASYTGAPIDGAKVRYRVVRETRYPDWFWGWWWRPQPNQGNQEITHGNAVTEPDGSFTITFVATPDRTVPAKHEPIFRYTVHADVTDTAGETRSGDRSVNVGYTALQASLSATDWQEKGKSVELTVKTTSPDGEARQAEGTITVYRLQEPTQVQRSEIRGYHRPQPRHAAQQDKTPEPNWSDPKTWPLGEVVATLPFATNADGTQTLAVDLEAGCYRAMLETQDRFKTPVTARVAIRVLDRNATTCVLKIPYLMTAPTWKVEAGETLTAVWGTGYNRGRAFIEIEHRNKTLRSFWSNPDHTQATIEQNVTEAMRGGFTVRVTMVRENRAHFTVQQIDVPWRNKNLQIKWEHFTSKLGPAEKETWTAIVTGPDAEKAVAEMIAGLYDESLDAYKPHAWQKTFNVFYRDYSRMHSTFENNLRKLRRIHGRWPRSHKGVAINYRSFPADVTRGFMQRQQHRKYRISGNGVAEDSMMTRAPMAMAMEAEPLDDGRAELGDTFGKAADFDNSSAKRTPPPKATPPAPDLSKVAARTNLQETAFFLPHLISDDDGRVKIEFTMPEALTRWKFMAFAHDASLRSGYLQDTVVTAKDLMVQPNPPRFMREGDELAFTVKVINQSPTRQQGTVQLTLADARTTNSVDADLDNTKTGLTFDIPAKESQSLSWTLKVPDGMGFLTYTAVASTGKLSDGEKGYLPVLPRRILVTESLPLPVRDAGKRNFAFKKLLGSGASDTLKHQSLTVQMVSQPAWYAVMALPYLMEYPYGCSEQVFNRLYANTLARHLANSDPKIRRIFDLWRGTETLDSPLEKNRDLKAVMLEETPWVRQAESESQSRRDVGILFDGNRLDEETKRTMARLAQMQLSSGQWPWFPGGHGNDYITLYITTGFGRMRHLGIKDVDMVPAIKALNSLDAWVNERYRWILDHGNKDNNNLTSIIAMYLYGRSFYLADQPIDGEAVEAVDYFLGQAKEHWLKLSRQSQAHLAVGVQRFGKDRETPQKIMASISEYAVSNEEMGMFWRDTEYSWWWYRAPIETQAMMIEAFDEVAKNADAVEACKVWLLKQKQTTDWKTTRATADAIYALLLRGTNLLASDALVEVALADMVIEPKNVEAGTGFYQERFVGPEVKPEMGDITVTKVDNGVSWGSVHWQYLEDMRKVTPHEATPLTLNKELYIKENTEKGPMLNKVKGILAVGDELVVRLVLRVDRDMEYVHLKDQRGSGTEPVNVLSRYRYQDGLAYYESTRDTASHFFIDYLPKGTYVFEYSSRIQHRGRYQTGIANIQCMYAPEFNSHSESFTLQVQ